MSRQRSLRAVLVRQWIAFGLALLAAFAAMTLLLLYMLEDSFIDRRLRDVAGGIHSLNPAPSLPERFEIHAPHAAPEPIRSRVDGLPVGGIREFRLPDERYVHVLSARTRAGEHFVLVSDATDELRVNAIVVRLWPWLALAMAALALIGAVLARAFMNRLSRQASRLVAGIEDEPSPARLHAYVSETAVREFAQIARHIAAAWDARLAALAREGETLTFLSHELRTPLQSARTSLALLKADRNHLPAWQRLERALARLARASASILWLSEREPPASPHEASAAKPLLLALGEELAPLAAQRGQHIRVRGDDGSRWPLPAAVLETVLANLLLNAVQHGDAGLIDVEIRRAGVRVSNPLPAAQAPAGFGLGLKLIERVLDRIGWTVRLELHSDAAMVTVEPRFP